MLNFNESENYQLNKSSLKESFKLVFKNSLIDRYGKIPSATFIANQFNIRANNEYKITRETARKWLNGSSLPELPRLTYLTYWLNLDLNLIFNKKYSIEKIHNKSDTTIDMITSILRSMDEKTQLFVLITAWAIRETNTTTFNSINLQALTKALLKSLSNRDLE